MIKVKLVPARALQTPAVADNIHAGNTCSVFCIALPLSLLLTDVRRINNQAIYAQNTGMVILGGGLESITFVMPTLW